MLFLMFFWGYETNHIIVGLIAGISLEIVKNLKNKKQLKDKDFITISDFNSILVVFSLLFFFLNYKLTVAPILFLKWIPIILLPVMFVQFYSAQNYVVIGTNFGMKKNKIHKHKPFDFSFLFTTITLFSSAVANKRDGFFLYFLILLFFQLFFFSRNKRFSKTLFLTLLIFISFSTFFLSKQAEITNRYISKKIMELWEEYLRNNSSDIFKTTTSIGDIGFLKQEDKIKFFVSGKKIPKYYKEASYSKFVSNMWYEREGKLKTLKRSDENWILGKQNRATKIKIDLYFNKKQGLLVLPYKVAKISKLNVLELKKNRTGAVFITKGAPFLEYNLYFGNKNYLPQKPNKNDLTIPKKEKYAIDKTAKQLKIKNTDTIKQKIAKIKGFFANFKYTLNLYGKENQKTTLGNFLLNKRAGHCELFATATVLLLRKFKIPARYAIGYAFPEKFLYTKTSVLRSRNAHAWVEAFVDKKWITIDTTPAIWQLKDKEEYSFFEPIKDFFGFLQYNFNLYRLKNHKKQNLYLSIAILVLIILLGLKIFLRLKKEKREIILKNQEFLSYSTKNSPFYEIEKKLKNFDIKKLEGETFWQWIERINKIKTLEMTTLKELYNLHQKLIFSKKGLSEKEMKKFRVLVKKWLEKINN